MESSEFHVEQVGNLPRQNPSEPLKVPRQEAYAQARAQGLAPGPAYMKAYEKPESFPSRQAASRGYQLYNLKHVQARVKWLSSEMAREALAENNVDRDWVIRTLKTVATRCLQTEEVFDRRGNPTGVYKFDPSGVNKACHLLGLEIGMYQGTDASGTDELDNMSHEALQEFVAEIAEQMGGQVVFPEEAHGAADHGGAEGDGPEATEPPAQSAPSVPTVQ